MTRWGYTARSSEARRALGVVPRFDEEPIRHAWDGKPAKRTGAPVHAVCGAALRGLGPRDEPFNPAHHRACRACRRRLTVRSL